MNALDVLKDEFIRISEDPPQSNISVKLVKDNFYEWEIKVVSSSFTHAMLFDIRFPRDYPDTLPQFKPRRTHSIKGVVYGGPIDGQVLADKVDGDSLSDAIRGLNVLLLGHEVTE